MNRYEEAQRQRDTQEQSMHKNRSQNLQTFESMPVHESEESDSGSEREILNHVDDYLMVNHSGNKQQSNIKVLNHQNGQQSHKKHSIKDQRQESSSGPKMTPKQILLNFKINELQKTCQSLMASNQALTRRLGEATEKIAQQQSLIVGSSQQKESYGDVLNNSQQEELSNGAFTDELTELQGEFVEIQTLIGDYKAQLSASEQKWLLFEQQKQQQTQVLNQQISQISSQLQETQSQLCQKQETAQVLSIRNQQLLNELEALEEQYMQTQDLLQASSRESVYVSHPYHYSNRQALTIGLDSGDDFRFNERIERELQEMVKKLMKELSHERKLNNRLNLEVKRLNSEVIEIEKVIRNKNNQIYQLEIKALALEKKNQEFSSRDRVRTKGSVYVGMTSYGQQPQGQYTDKRFQKQTKNIKYFEAPVEKRNHYPEPRVHKKRQISRKFNDEEQHYTDDRYFYGDDSSSYSYENVERSKTRETQNKSKNCNTSQNYYQKKNHAEMIQTLNPARTQILSINSEQPMSFIKPKKRKVAARETLFKPQYQNTPHHNFDPSTQQQSIGYEQRESLAEGSQAYLIEQSKGSESQAKSFKSYSLTYESIKYVRKFLSGEIRITTQQKILIISKIIEVYCDKLQNQNYHNLTPEQLVVSNFNRSHPKLIRVKTLKNANRSEENLADWTENDVNSPNGQLGSDEESLLWNMAFVVESLLQEVEALDAEDLEVDLHLSDIIEELLLKNTEDKILYFQELANSLEISII